ncbi:CheR family methyltransferase [Bacillus salitolerans]|uniref:CheR family methyltransferase n=1 Tax=Bacillus salitolerans TaxID=1437434 RepID=A0ABW4M064_9BACI
MNKVKERKSDSQSPIEECTELERIEIHLLLNGIYLKYGADFRNYAFTSIRRRIWHRIKAEKLQTVSSLLEKILHDPATMDRLYADFSINVTEMFRDPSFFMAFREKIVPQLKDLPFIRIWHAGCSTGEEAYSMAILLHEEGLYNKTRIYATDMNANVIKKAQTRKFPLHRMQTYTSNYFNSGGKNAFSEYYSTDEQYACFHSYLADNITFAQHNLVTDGSFNEFHVIICRNVLIYFNRELQNRVHQLFYDSLSPNGYLGLGNREGLSYTDGSDLFNEVLKKERIYQKK